MNKKLIAVAVAGALGAPAMALAQASTVQIYGTILVNYNYFDGGAGRPKVDMLNSHDANIGFKGEEALGGGLSAWFQCESTVDVTGAAAEAATPHWCGRNSGVGLKGAFGNVFFGIWDTPQKVVHAPIRPFSTSGAYGMGGLLWNEAGSDVSNSVTTTAAAVSSDATGAYTVAAVTTGGGTKAVSFTRRQTNSINYYTPNWSGFQGMIAYSSTNEGTGQLDTTTASKPRLWSLGLSYTNGPLYVMGGYEKHSDYNPANKSVFGSTWNTAAGATACTTGATAGTACYNGGTDVGWHLGIAYTFMGSLKVSAIYASQSYDTLPGQSLDHKAWGLFGDWNIQGPHRIRAEYVRADDSGGNATSNVGSYAAPVNSTTGLGQGDTGAKLYGIQYAYGFSKRTEVNFGYAKIANDANARYKMQTMGSVNVGQDQSAWVLGVKHTF